MSSRFASRFVLLFRGDKTKMAVEVEEPESTGKDRILEIAV